MNRSLLPELTTLENIIASKCYLVNWDKGDSITISKNSDGLSLKINLENNPLQDYSKVTLTEDSHRNTNANLLESITITDLHPESLILKPDHFSVQHFKPKTWNKACDYLILTNDINTDDKHAFFIDLKTSIASQPENGKLQYKKSEFDSLIVWQMLGSDLLFDNLIETVYKKDNIRRTNRLSVADSFKKYGKSELSKYKRHYIVLYSSIKPLTTTTNGGIRTTGPFIQPNPVLLNDDVYAFEVKDKDNVPIGALLAHST